MLEPLTALDTSLHDETRHVLIGFGELSDWLTDCVTFPVSIPKVLADLMKTLCETHRSGY